MNIKVNGILLLACFSPLALSGCSSSTTEAERAFTSFDKVATNGTTKNKIEGTARTDDVVGGNASSVDPFTAYAKVNANGDVTSVELDDGNDALTWTGSDSDTMIDSNVGNNIAKATKTTGEILLLGDPSANGFNYQTFGAWHDPNGTLAELGAFSIGRGITLAEYNELETDEDGTTLTFSGNAAGVHSDGTNLSFLTASANLTVKLDAGLGSTATFATNGTTDGTATDWSDYDLANTAALTVASGNITGNVATSHADPDDQLIGTISGKLYGSAGREAGGTFAVGGSTNDPGQTYIGGFGVKR